LSLELSFLKTLTDSQKSDVLLETQIETNRLLRRLVQLTPDPIVLLRSQGDNLSSNVADGVLILESQPCPNNFKMIVTDWNLNFTTVAGTVRVVVLDANGTIVNNVLLNVNSSINGNGGAVLEPGQRLAVIGSTAGAGVFGCYFSADKKQTGGFD